MLVQVLSSPSNGTALACLLALAFWLFRDTIRNPPRTPRGGLAAFSSLALLGIVSGLAIALFYCRMR